MLNRVFPRGLFCFLLATGTRPATAWAVTATQVRDLVMSKKLQTEYRKKGAHLRANFIPNGKGVIDAVSSIRRALHEEELNKIPSIEKINALLGDRYDIVSHFALDMDRALSDIGIQETHRNLVFKALHASNGPDGNQVMTTLFRIFGAYPEDEQREKFSAELTAFMSNPFWAIAREVAIFGEGYKYSYGDMLYSDLPKVRGALAEARVAKFLEEYEKSPRYAPEIKGHASGWIVKALEWAGVDHEKALELNHAIMNGGPYDDIPKDVAPHVRRFYPLGKRFADRFERQHPKSRLLRNIVSMRKEPPILTYDENTVPTLAKKIAQAKREFGRAEQGALDFLAEAIVRPHEEERVVQGRLANPIWETTFKDALVSLLSQVLLTGAKQIGKSMTAETAHNVAGREIHAGYREKGSTQALMEPVMEVLLLPGVQKAILEIDKLRSGHMAWRERYDLARAKKMATVAMGKHVDGEGSESGRLDGLLQLMSSHDNNLRLPQPFYGETVASYRIRTGIEMNEGDILGAIADDLMWTVGINSLKELLSWNAEERRYQITKRLPPIVREESGIVDSHAQYLQAAQKKVRELLAGLAQTRADREQQGRKWFEKSPVYGWTAPVLTDVVSKSEKTDTEVTPPAAPLSDIRGSYDDNLTYQGRAINWMAQKKPVNQLLRSTGWKNDIERDPFWLDDMPSSAPISGQGLPFVEVWSRFRQGLAELASAKEVGAFLQRFSAENGRSATGKGALLNVHRNMLERLAKYMEHPDQGLRKIMAQALAYDLAGYRPQEIAKVLAVDEEVIDEGFFHIRQNGLSGYFKGLSMSGDKDDLGGLERELRWRRGEAAPRVFVQYVFDGKNSAAIANSLGISVKEVKAIIGQIHELGADAYVDSRLLTARR